ncbi:uncharacterized protein MYCFIDRAFT_179210 [Pseudocercospora fijiensis CIRAD86]|uniref:Uncharacterized protein n=1 Tax=Pseudocercospora fijiensis (strain CIRAD86) TaxID=383855 RepID=M2ZZY0_PSEFD|nr:uncharacterized protein MYCFIDRAFT_179210 [Pseudocercospora fijiensis CIRAD86]EME77711.1 hypothetical protein MYCFIDRAFT_179210 [Pseudocercospora fijiensis CIRAD86]
MIHGQAQAHDTSEINVIKRARAAPRELVRMDGPSTRVGRTITFYAKTRSQEFGQKTGLGGNQAACLSSPGIQCWPTRSAAGIGMIITVAAKTDFATPFDAALAATDTKC